MFSAGWSSLFRVVQATSLLKKGGGGHADGLLPIVLEDVRDEMPLPLAMATPPA